MIQLPDPEYHRNVIVPYLATRSATVKELALPMIELSFTKEAALPPYLWGLVWDKWRPDKEQGNSIFLEGYGKARDQKKRVYYSAVTPDLYLDKFKGILQRFFQDLLANKNAKQPLMRVFMNQYFFLYWDLHLGVPENEVPRFAREIGECFMYCLASQNPFDPEFHRCYMRVRDLREKLDKWIDEGIDYIIKGGQKYDKTFAYYWIKNSEGMDEVRKGDVVFECFHNFLAFSQWGHMIYRVMAKLERHNRDATIRNCFDKIMASGYDHQDDPKCPFTPLDRFTMELFRVALPNLGSISAQTTAGRLDGDVVYTTHDHKTIGHNPLHWKDPEGFDPDRYLDTPTSDKITEEKCEEIGFTKCPFHQESFNTKDGRETAITNSGFGTVYNQHKGKDYPVCDYAGYSPFGFGYRRCPGELFTIEVFKEFLREIWETKVQFFRLPDKDPERLAVGPGTVVSDDLGFERTDSEKKTEEGECA